MRVEDLRELLSGDSDKYSYPELVLVARYPMRAPVLLEIKRYVRRKSDEAKAQNSRVPKDAYRHILWSYLLTKKFNSVFAEQVTNAHEAGVEGTIKARDSFEDYHNNELGRKYAIEKVAEEQLLKKVMTDPLVLRDTP